MAATSSTRIRYTDADLPFYRMAGEHTGDYCTRHQDDEKACVQAGCKFYVNQLGTSVCSALPGKANVRREYNEALAEVDAYLRQFPADQRLKEFIKLGDIRGARQVIRSGKRAGKKDIRYGRASGRFAGRLAALSPEQQQEYAGRRRVGQTEEKKGFVPGQVATIEERERRLAQEIAAQQAALRRLTEQQALQRALTQVNAYDDAGYDYDDDDESEEGEEQIPNHETKDYDDDDESGEEEEQIPNHIKYDDYRDYHDYRNYRHHYRPTLRYHDYTPRRTAWSDLF